MEENNGRTMTENEEIKHLKNLLSESFAEVRQLKLFIMNKRLDYLFKALDCKEFSTDFKVKAAEEIENILYPKDTETEEKGE